jgi:hypothetical protein
MTKERGDRVDTSYLKTYFSMVSKKFGVTRLKSPKNQVFTIPKLNACLFSIFRMILKVEQKDEG